MILRMKQTQPNHQLQQCGYKLAWPSRAFNERIKQLQQSEIINDEVEETYF